MGMNTKKVNVIKKILTLVLTICLAIPCFTMLTYAADGRIMFTDPSTKVGEVVEVRGVLESAGNGIEDREIVMSYDTSMLKFKQGENVSETSAGKLTYSVLGSQDMDGRVEFTMSFDVLQEGTAAIKVDSYKAWTAGEDYEAINCTVGSSAITIAAGETNGDVPGNTTTDTPTENPDQTQQIVVNGVTYVLTNDFPQTEIPEGFTQTTMEYAGNVYNVVFSDKYGMYLGYLTDEAGNGDFFLYSQEAAAFAPYAEITISEITKIMLLNNIEGITLPEPYVATTILVNGVDFPAWQNAEKSELCILYAVNTSGQKALYQLDSAEGTYQKFEAPEVQDEKNDDSFLGQLSESLQGHLDKVILGVGIGFVALLLLVIILAVKLFNRNAELDELYDEFGIDFEEEEPVKEKPVKENRVKKTVFREEDEEILDLDKEEKIVKMSKDTLEESEVVPDKNIEMVLENRKEKNEKETVSIDLSDILEDDSENDMDKHSILLQESNFYDDEDDDLDYEMDFIDLDD